MRTRNLICSVPLIVLLTAAGCRATNDPEVTAPGPVGGPPAAQNPHDTAGAAANVGVQGAVGTTGATAGAYGVPGANAIAPDDQQFVDAAARAGMTEVRLGTLATEQALHPDVKQFGVRMARDHGAAGDELTKLAQRHQLATPVTLDAAHQQMVDTLTGMTGAEFDREYMTRMVEAHQKAVDLFQHQSEKGANAELKAWAGKTLPILHEHLQMAKDVQGRVGAGSTP